MSYWYAWPFVTDMLDLLFAGKQAIMQQPVLLKPPNNVTLCAFCKSIQSMEILPNSTGEGDHNIYLYTPIYLYVEQTHWAFKVVLSLFFCKQEAAQKGLPICRHLFLHYPDDECVHRLSYQQFLVGSEFLVVPVLDKGKKKVGPED